MSTRGLLHEQHATVATRTYLRVHRSRKHEHAKHGRKSARMCAANWRPTRTSIVAAAVAIDMHLRRLGLRPALLTARELLLSLVHTN